MSDSDDMPKVRKNSQHKPDVKVENVREEPKTQVRSRAEKV
jgi:hypothetical protein